MLDARFKKYYGMVVAIITVLIILEVSLVATIMSSLLGIVYRMASVFLFLMFCCLALLVISEIALVIMNSYDREKDMSLGRNPNRTYLSFELEGNREKVIQDIDALLRKNGFFASIFEDNEIIYQKDKFVLFPLGCIKIEYEGNRVNIETFLYYARKRRSRETNLYSLWGNTFVQVPLMKMMIKINDLLVASREE